MLLWAGWYIQRLISSLGDQRRRSAQYEQMYSDSAEAIGSIWNEN
jgi:hypothetical protein